MAKIDVISEIAGRVWRIDAAVGSALTEEDPVITLECMKMEIPVVAPSNGTLVEVLVAEGEAVAEGQVIATLDG
jgi:acetyl-CoA carboxylase biotin carboxyl carrier protein